MAYDKESPDSIHKDKHGTIPRSYWMRVLEERYQRLHTKVVNGTGHFSTNKNLNYVAKRPPARHLKEYRQTAPAIANGKHLKENRKTEKANLEDCNQAACNLFPSSETPGQYTLNRQEKYVCNSKLENIASENKDQFCVIFTSIPTDAGLGKNDGLQNSRGTPEGPSTVAKHDLVDGCLPVSPCPQCSVNVCIQVNDHLTNHLESDQCMDNSYIHEKGFNTEEDTDTSAEPKYAETKQQRIRNRRNGHSIRKGINTWLCSTLYESNTHVPESSFHSENCIKYTHVKNGNANKGRRTVEHNTIYGAMQQLKSKGMNKHPSRLFARMSVEAQKAVDETIKEMKGDRVDTISQVENTNNTNGSHIYKHSYPAGIMNDNRQKTDSANKISGHKGNPSTPRDNAEKASADSLLRRKKATQEDLPYNYTTLQYSTNFSSQKKTAMHNHFVPNQEQATVKDTLTGEGSHYHLPLLEHKTVTTNHSMGRAHVNLPGIRNPRDVLSFRENTFEITPFNFDIRFHQIIPRHNEDRETPSPETQQQAIEKCHQWLVKYMSIN